MNKESLRKTAIILFGVLILLLAIIQVYEFRKFFGEVFNVKNIILRPEDIFSLAGMGIVGIVTISGIFNIFCSLFLIFKQKLPSTLIKVLFAVSLAASAYLFLPYAFFQIIAQLACNGNCGPL